MVIPFCWAAHLEAVLADHSDAAPEHVDVLMAEGRQPRLVLRADFVAFGAKLIEDRVRISTVSEKTKTW